MKSLSLSKPHVLVMIGAPGVGKTFFAEQFADTFKAPLISYERLHDQLFSRPTETKDEAATIARIADSQLNELLKTQRSIIIDGGAATRAERVALHKKVRDEGYEILYIWVQTDDATAKSRATKATRGSQKKNVLSEAQYEVNLKQFSKPSVTEKPIVISGKHTYATQVKVVLKKLVEPRIQQEEKVTSSTGAGNRHILVR